MCQQVSQQLQDVTSSRLASLARDLDQLQQRHEAASAQLSSDVAATRGQALQLKQWFDANQVCVCVGLEEAGYPRQVLQALANLIKHWLEVVLLRMCTMRLADQTEFAAALPNQQQPCCLHLQVEAKLSEEVLRQEVCEQLAGLSASLRAQLQEQQRHAEAASSGLQAQLKEAQAVWQAAATALDNKVRQAIPKPG